MRCLTRKAGFREVSVHVVKSLAYFSGSQFLFQQEHMLSLKLVANHINTQR